MSRSFRFNKIGQLWRGEASHELDDAIRRHAFTDKGICLHHGLDLTPRFEPGNDHPTAARHLRPGHDELARSILFCEMRSMRGHMPVQLFKRADILQQYYENGISSLAKAQS